MQHLGAAVDLLAAVGDGDRVELAARIFAAQDAVADFQVMAEPVSTWVHEIFEFCRDNRRAW